jgi:hypothetical protein
MPIRSTDERHMANLPKSESPADQNEYIVYDLRGVTYVPHFRNQHIYVGPGYPRHNMHRFTDQELQLMGAKPRAAMLWTRGVNGNVSNSNP